MLDMTDLVGVTFWIISAAMVAATYFFTVERDRAEGKWKTSLTVAALVTGIAAIHYFYMRGVWIDTQQSPIVFRYVDWLLTVPLQIVEFYLILAAIAVVRAALFWKLMIASLVMLIFGFLGEAGLMNYWVGFIIGMAGWLYMIYELYMGEGKAAVSTASPAVNSAYNAMMLIIVVGWSIYHAGYVAGYLMSGEGVYASNLNLIYNLADFINKILFGLIIWHVAVKESSHSH